MKNIKIKNKEGLSLIGKSVTADWVIIFSFVVVCFFVTTAISFYIYISIERNSVISNEEINTTNPLRVNTEQLDRVVENLNDRKEKFDTLTNGMTLSKSVVEATTTPETVDLVE